MGTHQTNQFNSYTPNLVPSEQFNFNFDLWAKAVRQQMLEALQTSSELTEDNQDLEDLSETLEDELE